MATRPAALTERESSSASSRVVISSVTTSWSKTSPKFPGNVRSQQSALTPSAESGG